MGQGGFGWSSEADLIDLGGNEKPQVFISVNWSAGEKQLQGGQILDWIGAIVLGARLGLLISSFTEAQASKKPNKKTPKSTEKKRGVFYLQVKM